MEKLGLVSVDSRNSILCRFCFDTELVELMQNSSQMLHEGVIASIVDNIGVAAFTSIDGHIRVSVDINVSYVSSAQIDVSYYSCDCCNVLFSLPIYVTVLDIPYSH